MTVYNKDNVIIGWTIHMRPMYKPWKYPAIYVTYLVDDYFTISKCGPSKKV